MKHIHHIIPRHMGGTDDPTNLVYLTVEEHAEAHRILFEQYGRWEDKIAWMGLSGQISKKEAIKMMLSEAGRKGGLMNDGSVPRHTIPHTVESKAKISKNNARSKAINTPFGVFESKAALAKYKGVTEESVRTIFNEKLDTPIDARGKHKLLGRENVGKTPRELGYCYV